jgi:hypothetical protein
MAEVRKRLQDPGLTLLLQRLAEIGGALAQSDKASQAALIRYPRDRACRLRETISRRVPERLMTRSIIRCTGPTGSLPLGCGPVPRFSRMVTCTVESAGGSSEHAGLRWRESGVMIEPDPVKKSGLIHYRNGHIRLVDRSTLMDSACECYGTIKAHADWLLGTQ